MPKRPCSPLGWLLLVSILLGAAACAPPAPKTTEDWQQRSLLSGPEVKVRILRQTYFSRLQVEWNPAYMEWTNEDGQRVTADPPASKAFIQQKGPRIAIAFKPVLRGVPHQEQSGLLRLCATTAGVQTIKVAIPDIGFFREYEGRAFEFSVKHGRLAVVHVLPLELYLARVLPAEMDPDRFPIEALKAQAVVARTWSLKNLNRHGRFGYNFCDGPHCQVYRGRKQVSVRAEHVVKMTLGEILNYDGKLAQAFYHSTCGGNTVFVEDVWGQDAFPYLIRVEDRQAPGEKPYCSHSPYAAWKVLTSRRVVERVLRKAGRLHADEELKDVQVNVLNRSGRVIQVLVMTNQRKIVLSRGEFRSAMNQEFGRRKILSAYYEIHLQGNQFSIRGQGLGHGVGLCQWGARGMAQNGLLYRGILGHYFQGTELGTMEPGIGSSEVTTQNSETRR